jgi:hypothetical protein
MVFSKGVDQKITLTPPLPRAVATRSTSARAPFAQTLANVSFPPVSRNASPLTRAHVEAGARDTGVWRRHRIDARARP